MVPSFLIPEHNYCIRAAGLILLGLLSFGEVVRAQAALVLVDGTALHEKAQSASKVVAEVPAGAELRLEWDDSTPVALRTEVDWSYHRRLSALLPVRREADTLWVRVRTADGRKVWVKRTAVEMVPLKELVYPRQYPLIVPLEPGQIPKIRQATFQRVDSAMFDIARLTANVRVVLLVDPEGHTRYAGVIRSSGLTRADAMAIAGAEKFVFEPPLLDGKPAACYLVLQLEYWAQ